MNTPVIATTAVQPRLDPRQWRQHRFGLTADRWAAMAGKAIWIRGAGSGFGRSVSVALAAAGATTVLTGRRQEKLEETRAEMAALGIPNERSIPVPADLTDTRSVDAATRTIVERVGRLDGVINNAGTFITGLGSWPLADQGAEHWDRLFDLNLRAPWYVSKAALPLLTRSGGIRILFITSGAGWAFTPGAGPYNVSKAALNSLGASFAAECADRYPNLDVQINIVNPGEALTEMNRGSTESPFILASIALLLLSHGRGGPNGRFFTWDGRHLDFCDAPAWEHPLQ